MGCRLRPCTISLSRPSIYGTGKAFSLNKSKGGGAGARLQLAWSSWLATSSRGSPQAQTNFPCRPPGFWGRGGMRLRKKRSNAAWFPPQMALCSGEADGMLLLWSPGLLLPCVLGKAPPPSWPTLGGVCPFLSAGSFILCLHCCSLHSLGDAQRTRWVNE